MEMRDWLPVYREILAERGWSEEDDRTTVRVLKAVTVNSDLMADYELEGRIGPTASVFGNAPCLEDDIRTLEPRGTLIASGSSVGRLMAVGIRPDIVVTDLDGDLEPQLEASAGGAVTLIHGHGDNGDLVRSFAHLFRGPVVLTTQSVPENTVYNFGGFTDGDRAVCTARACGAKEVLLFGFDYDHPMEKWGSDMQTKLWKLSWARRIVEDMNPYGVRLVRPDRVGTESRCVQY